MQIFHDLNEWQLFRKSLPMELSLGFAPTMGNLHIGHLSLFAASQKENDRTASSLFVNPTQFNQADDFTHYPRTLDRDLQLMIEAGVDYCLLPTEQFMYADGYRYQVQENQHSQVLEGTKRPGHFAGVLTVVMKLFNLVKPHRAYFGEKDYQQLQLIRDMTSAFFMDIEVIACPTIRETSGLACSSRNNRLTQEQYLIAEQFAKTFHKNGLSCQELIDELEKLNIEVEYLEELKNRRFAAIKIGNVRLIDNYELNYS